MSRKNREAKLNRGFTLIELLVVIAIIALLLSIVMPSLRKVKERAKLTVCKSNLKQVGVALHTYASQQKDGRTPNQIMPTLAYGGGYYVNAIYMYGFGTNPATNPPVCQGMLVEQGYLTTEALHCPSSMFPVTKRGQYGGISSYHIRDDHVKEVGASYKGYGMKMVNMKSSDTIGGDAWRRNAGWSGDTKVNDNRSWHFDNYRNFLFGDAHIDAISVWQRYDYEDQIKNAYEGGLAAMRKR